MRQAVVAVSMLTDGVNRQFILLSDAEVLTKCKRARQFAKRKAYLLRARRLCVRNF
jgi:hypothetical protein